MSARPKQCADCAMHNPYLIKELDGRWVCEHRHACEARQMLKAGATAKDAVEHAQKGRQW